MVIGILKLTLRIHDTQSLKEKRKVVKSVIARIRNKFNVSIAEVGSNDKWQIAELGICTVGNDRRFINSTIDNILSYLDSIYIDEIIHSDIEILNV